MITRLFLLLAACATLFLSSCVVPEGVSCNSYSLGPAYNGEGRLYARPSYVVDHSYPTSFEPIHHYCERGYVGGFGYGTDTNAQIPYFYR